MEFVSVEGICNEVGEFSLSMGYRRCWRILWTGEEMGDEPGTHTNHWVVAIERIGPGGRRPGVFNMVIGGYAPEAG
jgi:hypothetical protein